MAKRDPAMDAKRYQDILKQQASRKRATEDQAKEEIDRLSNLVAAVRQMGATGGEAETELDKANAALRDKDWTGAFNFAVLGLGAGQKAAQAAARTALGSALQKMYDVERIGIAPDELAPLASEARQLAEQGQFLDSMRKSQELKAKSMQLGRDYLEEALANLRELIEHDRFSGVNVSAPLGVIEQARRMLQSGDIDFDKVTEIISVDAPAAREAALRGVGSDGEAPAAPEAPEGAEDREALRRAVEEAFQLAETEIQTARALKANVAAAEKDLQRAKSALDSNDLKTARSSARRSIVGAMAAGRKSINGLLQDAAAELRRLRLAGANVTELRKNLATAKVRAAEGGFKEAAEILTQLTRSAAATREEQQRLIKEVDQTYDHLVKLTHLGIVPTDAIESLEEARNYARRGDVERAQGSLKRATQAARDFWGTVGNEFNKEMRDLVLESRKMGGNIGATRAVFNNAKQALDEGKYEEAIEISLRTIQTLQGTPAPYHEALTIAAGRTLDIGIATKLGILRAQDRKTLDDSPDLRSSQRDDADKPPEVYAEDLTKHKATLGAVQYEFKSEQERFQRVIRRTLELENEVEEGKKIGTDMTRAEELLFNARAQITKRRFPEAENFLKEIDADITRRKDARIEELLRDADTDLKHLRGGGVYVEDVEREVREARAQHANHNYEVAVDLIQDAISTALERQQDLEAARREFQKADSLIEQGAAYAADVSVAVALLDEARVLSREHDDRDARAIATQAVSEAQTSLARFIDLILEETARVIEQAEADYGEFPDARQRLQECKRLREQGEVGDALVNAREIAEGVGQSVQTIQEIRQKVELVESYIAWASQFSKTIVMPHKLLEHARERLQHFSLEAAREAVNEAAQKAEEALRQFIRSVHRETLELIDEYEDKGVPLTAGRNLMMQAQGLLETKNFPEAYRVAMTAQELSRKSFDIFQRTQRAVGELESEVHALEGFGIESGQVTALLEKASAAFASEDYETANVAITEAQALVPRLKEERTTALEKEIDVLMASAKSRRGLNMKKFREAFDHCIETRKSGDMGLAIEILGETKRDLAQALQEAEAVEVLLKAAEERLHELQRIGLETKALADAKALGQRRLEGADLKEAASILKRGLKQSDKDAAAFTAARVDALVSEALAMRVRGYPTENVIHAAEAGSEALLKGDYAAALSLAAAAAETLKAIPERVDSVRRNESRGRVMAQLLQEAFQAPAQDAAYLLELDRALERGDLEGAERESVAILESLSRTLSEKVFAALGEAEGRLAEAEGQGASTSAAAEAIRLGHTALEQGLPEAAAHWSRAANNEVRAAVEDVKVAAELVKNANALLADAQAFGAATDPIEQRLAVLKQLLKARRHRLVKTTYRDVELAWHGAKKERVDARKAEVLASLQRAAKLGLPQDGPRKLVAQAERSAAQEEFEQAVKVLDDLEREVGTALERHDELSKQFEAVADLLDSFSDLKIDFKQAGESRDHARTALEKFELGEAGELIELFRKEVEAILTSHALSKIQALVKGAGAALAEGIVVRNFEERARTAEEELNNQRFREAMVAAEQGMEELAAAKRRFVEVQAITKQVEQLLLSTAPLGIDLAQVKGALEGAASRMKEGAYDEAKVEADYALETGRAARAGEVERRLEELTSKLEEAASLGVAIESERASLKKARDAAEAGDFAKLIDLSSTIEASLAKKEEERQSARAQLEHVRELLDQLERMEIPAGEFSRDNGALEKLTSAGDFRRALSSAQALESKLVERMRARVEHATGETAAVLRLCAKSGSDTGNAQEQADRAKALAAEGKFLEAYEAATGAERTAYESKDRYDQAKQVMQFVADNFQMAAGLKIETADLDALRMTALDAFEFQSYEEATATGLETLGKINRRLGEAFLARLQAAGDRAESLEMGGANVGILRRETEFAESLVANEDFISADISLGGTERRLARMGKEFAEAREAQERLSALIEVAGLLNVEARAARSALDGLQALFDQGKYGETRAQALELRKDLARGCAVEVQKRVDAAGEAVDALGAADIPTGALAEGLDRAAQALIGEDYVAAFSIARQIIDDSARQKKGYEAAREAVRAARRMLAVAEGLEADASAGRETLSEAELLFRQGDFDRSGRVAHDAREALSSAAASSAGIVLTEAEQNLEQFTESGVKCAPADDCLNRSRQAYELHDFLGSIRYSRLATRLAEDTRRQMGVVDQMLADYKRLLDRADGIVELVPEDRAALSEAQREFDGGQMRRASLKLASAREALTERMKDKFAKVRGELAKAVADIGTLNGDPSPTIQEIKEADNALAEGRVLDALEGAVTTRALARDSLGELLQAKATEFDQVLGQAQAAGVEVNAAREPLASLKQSAWDLAVEQALPQAAKVKGLLDAAVKARAEVLLSATQKATEHRFFKSGAGAQQAAGWRAAAAELGTMLAKGEPLKSLAALDSLNGKLETGIAGVVAEKLVEVDALRDAHGGRRQTTAQETELYERVAAVADRGRAQISDLDAADRLDQLLRDLSSKFVADSVSRTKREIMTFEDKAAVERLGTLVAAVEKVRSNPAAAVSKTYELLDGSRELFEARAVGLIKQADKRIEIARSIDIDVAGLQDFVDRAHASLEAGDLPQSIEFAENLLKEAARLEEAQVLEILRKVKGEYEAAPEGKAKTEAKRMLYESMQARQSKDFEAAYDFARKAREALITEARDSGEEEIRNLLQLVAKLEAAGVDCTEFRDKLEEVRSAYDRLDANAARRLLTGTAETVKKRFAEWEEVSTALAQLTDRVVRASAAKIDLADLPRKLEGAREKMRRAEFAAVKKEIQGLAPKLDELLSAKVKAMISGVQAKLKHNRNMEIDSRAAEELLTSAQKLHASRDLEGAFDAATRAAAEADGAKEVSRQVRTLGEQGTELLERAVEVGVSLSEEQEQIIFDAAKGRLRGGMKLQQLEALLSAVREQLGSGGARFELSFTMADPPIISRSNNAVLEINNRGDGGAEDVRVAFFGEASVKAVGSVPTRVDAGDRAEVDLQIITRKLGDVPFRLLLTYTDVLTGEARRRTERRWLTFFDPTDTTEAEQFARRQEKCLICVGVIAPTELMKVCECQSTFHLHCAGGVRDCPKCGRSLAES